MAITASLPKFRVLPPFSSATLLSLSLFPSLSLTLTHRRTSSRNQSALPTSFSFNPPYTTEAVSHPQPTPCDSQGSPSAGSNHSAASLRSSESSGSESGRVLAHLHTVALAETHQVRSNGPQVCVEDIWPLISRSELGACVRMGRNVSLCSGSCELGAQMWHAEAYTLDTLWSEVQQLYICNQHMLLLFPANLRSPHVMCAGR